MVMSQTRAVLNKTIATDEGASFRQDDEETGNRIYIVTIDGNVYKELGSPEQITITIEPGDKLNGEG